MKESLYIKDNSKEVWWCLSHNRQATHIINIPNHINFGEHCCDPSLGGIMLPYLAELKKDKK